MFPTLLPPPDQKQFNLTTQTKDIDSIIKYRDAVDIYVEYLEDYSRRISESHGLVSKHRQGCPVVLMSEPLTLPSYPVTAGMGQEETISALVKYIGDLRGVIQNHNRSEQLLKEKSLKLCQGFR
jgi:hypothetical protein